MWPDANGNDVVRSVISTLITIALVIFVACFAVLTTAAELCRRFGWLGVLLFGLTLSAFGAVGPRVQATIYSTDPCAPCRRYVGAVKREMPPDGWVVRDATDKDAATAHVLIAKATAADQITASPTTIIRRDGREVDRIVGQITPTQLAKRINKLAQ